jgi:hypothetical protein
MTKCVAVQSNKHNLINTFVDDRSNFSQQHVNRPLPDRRQSLFIEHRIRVRHPFRVQIFLRAEDRCFPEVL